MKKLRNLVAALLVGVMLVGCGGSSSNGGKEITVDLGAEPPELNTFMTSTSVSGNVLRHIVEGLVTLDANDKAAPGMAKSWDVSEDKLTVTFHLREGAKWSNGEEVTAKDFVFAQEQLYDARNGAPYGSTWAERVVGAQDLFKITSADKTTGKLAASDAEIQAAKDALGVKAIDDYTLEFKLTGPYDYFVELMAFYSFAPINEKAYKEMGGLDKYAKEADAMVYNGPFKIESWSHESEMVLVKNEDYWNKDAIGAEKITMTMITDSNTRENEFRAGNIDVVSLTGLQAKEMKTNLVEGADLKSYDDGSIWYLEYNTSVKGLNNAKIRRALTLAIDAQAFIDSIVQNDSTVAYSFTPPAIQQGTFNKAVADAGVSIGERNVETAKALLAEGLAEENLTVADLKVAMITDDTDVAKKNCEFVQEQLRANLGVEIQVEQMPHKQRIARMDAKDFAIVFAGWSLDYNDPMTYMDLWLTGGGNNHTNWSNAQYDKLIADAAMEGDTAKRTDLLVQAEKILMEECPIGIIYNRKQSYVVSSKIKNVIRTASTDLDCRYVKFN